MACEGCLVRSWLLGRLAGHIEKVAVDAPGRRSREILALGDAQLALALAGPVSASRILAEARPAGREIAAAIAGTGGWAVCRHDPDWPAALGVLGKAAPRALLGIGDRTHLGALAERPAVAVVGARRATAYGRGVARELATELAVAGLAVVSGLAHGADAASHRGALEGGGLTVAVLGSGPDVAYPPANAGLYRRIAERGLVLSEMPPGFRAYRWSFPARNRIIAALAEMTVVVEAAERSGSLITSGMAADLGREVGAVPGPVRSRLSRGTNALLADGAAVVRDANDVLDRLLGPGIAPRRPAEPKLEPALAAALAAVEGGAATPDEIAIQAGLDGAGAATALARLELLGYLGADSSGRYSRSPR
jgi:DNA processing protein